MANRQRDLFIQFNQFSDALVIAFVFWLAHAFREQLAFSYPLQFAAIAPFRAYKWLYLVVLPVTPFVLDVNGFYSRRDRFGPFQVLGVLLKSVTIASLIVIAAMYFLGMAGLARGVIVLFAFFTVLALFAKDRLTQMYLGYHPARSRLARQVILVGSPEGNAEFQRRLEEHPEWNMQVITTLAPGAALHAKLVPLLHRHPIACVIFNVGQTAFNEVEKAIVACEIEGVEAWLVADFVRTSIARATVDDFFGKPLLVFRTTPDISWQLVCKRLLDIAGAAVGLAVAGPLLMLPAAIAIRCSSPGPILFRQKRSGLHGRVFTMLKFRSMVDNAEMLKAELQKFNEMSGPVFKITEDPRVTGIGRFLRKTSLDELPQLWNVLLGDMSLVGPRPLPVREVEQFDPWHRRRLSVKPGLTCLWQISGRNEIDFEEWMRLDLQYIDNWSLRHDLAILLRTIPVVLTGVGAK
jgi:exopolysaccharide biosynthesis polyprenyl glycosylphosphotransferase